MYRDLNRDISLQARDIWCADSVETAWQAAAFAKHAGARHVVVTDINPYRLRLAERAGTTRTVDVRKENMTGVQQNLKMKEGFDVAMEMFETWYKMTSMPQTGFDDVLPVRRNSIKFMRLAYEVFCLAISHTGFFQITRICWRYKTILKRINHGKFRTTYSRYNP